MRYTLSYISTQLTLPQSLIGCSANEVKTKCREAGFTDYSDLPDSNGCRVIEIRIDSATLSCYWGRGYFCRLAYLFFDENHCYDDLYHYIVFCNEHYNYLGSQRWVNDCNGICLHLRLDPDEGYMITCSKLCGMDLFN